MPQDFAGNTLVTARELNLTPSPQTISDSVGPLDNHDYYSFTLGDSLGDSFASGSSLSLSLNGLSANADLELLDSNGQVLQTSAQPGTNAESIYTTLVAGTYYIDVYPAANAFTNYNLSFSATPTQSASSTQSQDPLTAFGNPTFQTGVFTVDQAGEVSFDFLFDSGAYQGELAIFSLQGMDASQLGSQPFIQEAAQRALSNSQLGHVVISDSPEGARFSGTITGERQDWNAGVDQGVKTFAMNPGDQFGLMLVPNGTVQQVLNNSSATGALHPLFSMATADPNDAFDGRQFADVNGHGNTLAIEDQDIHGHSDRDYNDIVFQMSGAAGQTVRLDDVINPAHDWRTSQVGGKLMEFINPPANQPLIGIIDTGVSAENPDIDPFRIHYGPNSDYVAGDGNPLLQSGQGSEHGTQIAGIIAATQGNGIGIDGINDQAPIYVARATGSGQWAQALTDFVDAAVASGQPHAVVNLSFDLTQINPDASVTTRYELTPAEREALEYARQHGVLIVVAAGNDGGLMSVLGQASQEFDNIITVGSVQQVSVPTPTAFPDPSLYPNASTAQNYARTGYSNYGYGLDLVTEGGTIDNPVVSTTANGVGTIWGTSVATAKVTGAASQVWAANPGLSDRQVIDILEQTTTDLQAPGWDLETGYGLLNTAAAVGLATTTAPQSQDTPTILTPTTWDGQGNVTPTERAASDYFSGNGNYYDWVPYTIRSGDTLSDIAQRTMGGNTAPYYNFIANHNNIANPNLIYPGTRIEIPQEVSPPPPPSNGTPTVSGNFNQVWQQNRATLGSPIEDVQHFSSNVDYQRFEHGSIVSSPAGTFPLYGSIRQTYLNTGGLEGWLGAPTNAPTAQGNGVTKQIFEHGYILYNGQTATAYQTGTVTPTPHPSNGSLDRQAAVNYADHYDYSRNPRYHDYSNEGGNCANFVSQCLVAGGLLRDRADSSGKNPDEYINANDLTNYLLDQDLAEEVNSVNQLQPRDVIAYSNPSTHTVGHVTLYIGDSKVASNTSDGIFTWNTMLLAGGVTPTPRFIHIVNSASDSNPPVTNSSNALVAHDGHGPGDVLTTVNTVWGGTKNITVGAVDTDENVEAVLAAIRAFENSGRYGSNGGSTPGDSGASHSIGAYQETYPQQYIPIGNRVMGTNVTVDQFYQGNPLAQDIAAIGRLESYDVLDLIKNSNLRNDQQRLEVAQQVVNAWGSWYSDRDQTHSTQAQKDQYKQAHSQVILAALNIA